MKINFFMPACIACLLASNIAAAGMAHNANFVVTADDKETALALLAKAEQFRREIAQEWLGEELPPGIGRAILDVQISGEDSGRTWTIDGERHVTHMVWLATTRELAIGSMLRHELTHVVLETWAPGEIPAWAGEGAASLADDADRIDERRRTIAWFARTGKWPSLAELFRADQIPATDRASYAAAASVTEFLLSRPGASKRQFVRFAVQAKRDGYRAALWDFYRINDVGELERQWKAWSPNK